MSKYYCLISSLPELFFETENYKNFDFLHIRDYILEGVSATDADYVCRLLNGIDNRNLITVIYGKNRAWTKGGQLEFRSIADLNKSVLPDYMISFLEYIDAYETENKSYPDELVATQYLWKLYYDEVENADNKFIAKWFGFDREMKNIQTAYLCRRSGESVEKYLVKNDDLTGLLMKNTSPDFGLSRERDYMPELFRALEIQDLLERENKLDMLRWRQIDEINTMEYFTLDVALGTLQKAHIADRWLKLDGESGKQLFRKLIDDLIKKL
jgi:hypothetical protein